MTRLTVRSSEGCVFDAAHGSQIGAAPSLAYLCFDPRIGYVSGRFGKRGPPLRNPSPLIRAVVIPASALIALVWVLHQSGYSYSRVATFIVVFILVADLASFVRGASQNALIVVAALVFGMGALETIALLMLPHVVLLHPTALWTDRFVLGWGPKAGGVFPVEKLVDGKSIYRVTYTIDNDLLRHTKAPGDAPTIGFFGDSFTFGEGLNDGDTLEQSFADIVPGFHVVNLAFSAYSPSQALRELQVGLFDRQLSSPRLFVLQTGPWHSERTSCKPNFSVRGPRYATVDGTLRFEGPCTSGLARRVAEFYKETAAYAMFLAPILQRPSHYDIENYVNIVAAIAEVARDKYHVPLVVLYMPPADRYLNGTGFTDQDIRARLAAAGAHLVDGTLDPNSGEVLAIPGDGHPTGTANRLLARRIVDDLRRTMPDVIKPLAASAAKG